jgi:NADPH2:quinone reductase
VKAVRLHEYGGPDVLVYEDVDKPVPSSNQILVRVAAASVNPVDVAVRENRFPTPKEPPKIIGSDGAGVVEAVGADVDGVAVGAEVFFNGLGVGSEGSYAEYVLLAPIQAVPKPADLSFIEAAAMGMVFPTAYYALVTRGRLAAGETVLVQGGAGGVGSASIQIAKALGARVFTTVGNEVAAALVKSLGADASIDRHKEDVVATVKRLTDGRGVDLVHELVASENLAADLTLIAKGGRIVVTGAGSGAESALPLGAAIGIDATILFMNLGNAGRAAVAEMMVKIGELAREGKIKPVVGATLPLAEARHAHELLAGEHFGKIVLVP